MYAPCGDEQSKIDVFLDYLSPYFLTQGLSLIQKLWLSCLASKLVSALQGWGYGHVRPCPDFYMDDGDGT